MTGTPVARDPSPDATLPPVTPQLLAHGFGDVGDLPVTLPLLLSASGGSLLGAAALVSARGSRERSTGRGVPLPSWLTALAGRRAARGLVRALAAGLLGVAAVTAALGAPDVPGNPAPALLYTVLWAGVLLVGSLLLGPVWTAANPLRSVSAALARLTGDPEDRTVRPLPDGLGIWPAAGLLAVVVWLEVAAQRQPSSVLVLIVGYALVQVWAAAIYGRAWYAHGDGFEVYSRLVGWLAPVGRAAGGRLALRSPRRTLAAAPVEPGLLAVLAVLLGAHLYDGLSGTLAWQQLAVDRPPVALQTAGLAACVALVAALVAVTTRATYLRPALAPVVAAYALAHYLGPLLVESQHTLVALSDALGRGADLSGLAGRRLPEETVPAALAALGQLAAFVGFHVLAVVVAHDRAVARHDPRSARAVQFPLRVLLLASVLGGAALRFAGQ